MSDEEGNGDYRPIKPGELVFVYGTLRKGERAARMLEGDAEYIGNDRINGNMYHLGAYPGFKDPSLDSKGEPIPFDPNKPSILGEVHYVRTHALTAVLDAYEGFPYLYTRCVVLTAKDRPVWVYVYRNPVTQDQLIETGDWKNPRMIIDHSMKRRI